MNVSRECHNFFVRKCYWTACLIHAKLQCFKILNKVEWQTPSVYKRVSKFTFNMELFSPAGPNNFLNSSLKYEKILYYCCVKMIAFKLVFFILIFTNQQLSFQFTADLLSNNQYIKILDHRLDWNKTN